MACRAKDCPYCSRPGYLQWYAPACTWRLSSDDGIAAPSWRWEQVCQQITDSAFRQMESVNPKWEGLMVQLKRRVREGQAAKERKAEVIATVLDRVPGETPTELWAKLGFDPQSFGLFRIGGWLLPAGQPFAIKPALMRLWGLSAWPDQRELLQRIFDAESVTVDEEIATASQAAEAVNDDRPPIIPFRRQA